MVTERGEMWIRENITVDSRVNNVQCIAVYTEWWQNVGKMWIRENITVDSRVNNVQCVAVYTVVTERGENVNTRKYYYWQYS